MDDRLKRMTLFHIVKHTFPIFHKHNDMDTTYTHISVYGSFEITVLFSYDDQCFLGYWSSGVGCLKLVVFKISV